MISNPAFGITFTNNIHLAPSQLLEEASHRSESSSEGQRSDCGLIQSKRSLDVPHTHCPFISHLHGIGHVGRLTAVNVSILPLQQYYPVQIGHHDSGTLWGQQSPRLFTAAVTVACPSGATAATLVSSKENNLASHTLQSVVLDFSYVTNNMTGT
ncbi:hypothetical protein J6590_003792 [Homalodisca vitripennis]|nr:hypothetical protein J6590_003792 [Homalodisca vitripennis]